MATRVTIQDIADALGLSRNTVSKAINNTGVLAEATREKILHKAVEMGYKQFSYVTLPPKGTDPSGLSLVGAPGPERPGVISLLTTRSLNNSHFASTMLDRLQRELSGYGFSFMTHRVTAEDIEKRQVPSTFRPAATDGILCIELFDPDYAEFICSLEKPTLFVDAPSAFLSRKLPSDLLLMDNRTEIMTFVRQMVEAGKTRFGFVGDIRHCISFYERYQALKEALYMAGLPLEERYCINDRENRTGKKKNHEAYRTFMKERFAALDPLPEVLLCANDFIAIDAIQVLKAEGVRIPEDILFCGFDDSPESRVVTPSLTTVHIHSQIMGCSACHLLLTRIAQPELNYRTVHTETTLIMRDSTRLPGE